MSLHGCISCPTCQRGCSICHPKEHEHGVTNPFMSPTLDNRAYERGFRDGFKAGREALPNKVTLGLAETPDAQSKKGGSE